MPLQFHESTAWKDICAFLGSTLKRHECRAPSLGRLISPGCFIYFRLRQRS